DGRTHELRISAPHHRPATLLFRDVPPPKAVRLEPLDPRERPEDESAPAGSLPARRGCAA
ncbi:MAG TPA: hypothetical protein VMG12_44250, partial [Polyangiaceae bacterium]|nr:hypothetical protein [Polyangiaceae bacterium]